MLIAWFRHVADCVMSISRCFCAIFTALIGVRPRLSLCFCWVLTNLSVCLAIQHIPTYFPNQDVIFDQVWMKNGVPHFRKSTISWKYMKATLQRFFVTTQDWFATPCCFDLLVSWLSYCNMFQHLCGASSRVYTLYAQDRELYLF